MVMTDQQALSQLQSLFKQWQRDPETSSPTGLAPLREAFRHLYTIRPWGPEDRIKETGVLDDWKYRVQQGDDQVKFEAELWFRKDDTRRQQAQSELQRIIESHKGQVIAQCVITEIAYHSVIGAMPIADLQAVIDDPNTERTRATELPTYGLMRGTTTLLQSGSLPIIKPCSAVPSSTRFLKDAGRLTFRMATPLRSGSIAVLMQVTSRPQYPTAWRSRWK